MSVLRLATLIVILTCSSLLYAFEQMPDDPSNVMAPKRVAIQLCSPTSDAGAGCNPADRVSCSTTYAMRNGVNAAVTTVRYGINELSRTPRMVRESLEATASQIREASNVSVQTTDSMFAVLYRMTTTFLRIAYSSLSALASAIWPF